MTEFERKREYLIADSIAHAARSPLSVIAGLASALRAAQHGSAESRASLDKIVRETQRLSRMLENRVVAAKIEAGIALRREWVSVEELIGAALARLDAVLEGRPIATDVGGDLVAHVDPMLGELMIDNIIDNVLGHTPATSPIELAGRREGSLAIIEISDRGPGLPADARRLLTDPSAPLDPRLGLQVCRAIANAYDGRIDVVSRPGGGTIVRITLPDAAAPEQGRAS